MKPHVTQERLREVLLYAPTTGVFTWRISWRRKRAGEVAGGPLDERGYCRIGVDGKRYHAHRLAFIYMTGSCPAYVDHIDLDCGNNRWANLRGATKSQNGMNRQKNSNNTTGVKGVYFQANAYVAEICVAGLKHYLGRFPSLGDATAAVIAARSQFHGEFAHD